MSITKSNGTKIRAHSKHKDCKLTQPKTILSSKNLMTPHIRYVNVISLEEKPGFFVRAQILKVSKGLSPNYTKKQYLTKDTLVETTKGSAIITQNVKGHLKGKLL